MSDTGTPVTKSKLIAAAERVIRILADHPALEQTVSSVDIYGSQAVTLAGNITIHARGKQAELDQWVAAVDGQVSTPPREPAAGNPAAWLASVNSHDGAIHVLVTTDRQNA